MGNATKYTDTLQRRRWIKIKHAKNKNTKLEIKLTSRKSVLAKITRNIFNDEKFNSVGTHNNCESINI